MGDVLGGKGAGLAEMCRLSIPVPPGFTIPTDACRRFLTSHSLDSTTLKAMRDGMTFIHTHTEGACFGDHTSPLLVSVRSGAAVSMPGMMDTVLNVGLNRATVEGLAKQTGDRRFALDSYRRFIQMYGETVRGIAFEVLETPLREARKRAGVEHDNQLSADELARVVDEQLAAYQYATGHVFPEDPWVQLETTVAAVFGSWHSDRAIVYRRMHGMPNDLGTAANIQAMVFGNRGDLSGTGVVFTRNPSTGHRELMGEWMSNAQGEDLVAGIRTPSSINEGPSSLQHTLPKIYDELISMLARLEKHQRDMQDVEFTVQDGTLYLLQTRAGKRTAYAAITMAVDMVDEGLIDKKTALLRVEPEQLRTVLHSEIDPDAEKFLLAQGLGASPGAASGVIVLTPGDAERLSAEGTPVILVRRDTSPEDIHGMKVARGMLTETGGMTSHAAVVARGMGVPCVSGCKAMRIDADAGMVYFSSDIAEAEVRVGDVITLDGRTGSVFLGEVPRVEHQLSDAFETLMAWADEVKKLGVRANADTPEDAAKAVQLGAQGIGLCRTEHMFFSPDRIVHVRAWILAEEPTRREAALHAIEGFQRDDFSALFRVLNGYPMTVRLLDPPLHEFLPHGDDDILAVAQLLDVTVEHIRMRTESLSESNPMLGHRGCRLGITDPDLYAAQARAYAHGACDAVDAGTEVKPEIMIPLVMVTPELVRLREVVQTQWDLVMKERGHAIDVLIGTMIELPRAALVADKIAVHADFFSFGTNDLTQTALGLSRDDAGSFLDHYLKDEILIFNPFQRLDEEGVGALVRMGIDRGRQARPSLKVGVCGEHGGDAASIHFFNGLGVDYVSCSPYRVPVARLAAAQAVLLLQPMA